eukprot:5322696-Pyramimonas_sp.AAC.1
MAGRQSTPGLAVSVYYVTPFVFYVSNSELGRYGVSSDHPTAYHVGRPYYGLFQLAFTYVRAVQLLPYPASWPTSAPERRVLRAPTRPEPPRRTAQQQLEVYMGEPPRSETLLRCDNRSQ